MENELNAKDLLDAVKRNRGWLAAPFLTALTIGSAGAFLWPDTYVSSALLRVMPPAASSAVIPDVFNTGTAERIASMQQSILSRTTLTGLIETYKLYPGERARAPLEDVVERMRRDVVVSTVTPATGGDRRHLVFRIAFEYPNRFDAQRVAQNLVSRFLHENQSERGRVLDSVNRFLRDEFDRADGELRAIETRLSGVRRGRDGTQLHRLSLLEARASAANAGLARARQEMALLESELRAARDRVRRPAPSPPSRNPLELEMEKLLTRYKPTHPDVIHLQNQIDAMRAHEIPVLAAMNPEFEERVIRAEGQVRAKALEIARLESESAEAARAAAKVTEQAADNPIESEQLVREHELAQQRFREARRKLLEAEGASKSNAWSLSENLELLDAPTLPESPVAPNRALIAGASGVMGLLLGAILIWLRESNDEAIRTIRQLRALTASKVLGSIPLLENELVLRRRRRAAVLAWASASLLSVVSIVGAMIYHQYRQL